jgi:hypothetical protein
MREENIFQALSKTLSKTIDPVIVRHGRRSVTAILGVGLLLLKYSLEH